MAPWYLNHVKQKLEVHSHLPHIPFPHTKQVPRLQEEVLDEEIGLKREAEQQVF